ncbi:MULTISPECIES: hypothetical protein [Actinomadura]|uniref:Uncharacterized protein n=1 Tax=Actinomadura yumaensis TaxID=111807 RepID=A0ABW2CZV5_9ACTN|nr:hypothetical protein [Actinomadura sp. J1-007]MWK36402.1 hypothetical protein [Actinomadura sp. J1-007]
MQLPRVVIAAVFFVIGALIAIPALMKTTSSESRASSSPESTSSSPSPSTSGSGTGDASTSPSPSRGSRSPSPSPSTSRTTTKPPSSPVKPLTATVGAVRCPGRTIEVTVHNRGPRTEDYGIERDDDAPSVPGRITAGATRTTTLKLREDRGTRLQVTWKNEPLKTRTVKANCKKAGGGPAPSKTPPSRLPHTGADDGVIWARTATGGAAMITGLIIFWYGGIWPRRRDQVFAKKAD